MVRRLIQRFLHWLRQLLTHTNGAKQSPQPLRRSRQLPPPVKHQSVPSSQSVDTQQQPHQQTLSQPPNHSESEHQPSRAPLNPASPRAANPSQFQVLISDYKYSPSTAVQDLNHQLSHPQTPTVSPHQKQQKTPPSESFPEKISPTQKVPASDDQEQTHQSITLPFQQENLISPQTNSTTQKTSTPTTNPEQSTVEARAPSHALLNSTQTLATPTTQPNLITKQGIIKLLFKLKKNNHHGYIAPEDGSKDIIFHKKFIGNDVFSQLERGMKVEVTAHITEGKAYADVVRIL